MSRDTLAFCRCCDRRDFCTRVRTPDGDQLMCGACEDGGCAKSDTCRLPDPGDRPGYPDGVADFPYADNH